MNQQERFETYYADQHCVTLESMILNRMGDTYRMPGIAAHYRTFKGVEALMAAENKAIFEIAARTIYETWSNEPGYVPWVDGGNSLKQDEARGIIQAAVSKAVTRDKDVPGPA